MATSVVLLVLAKSVKAFCIDNTRFYGLQDEQKLFLQAFVSGTMAQTTMSRVQSFSQVYQGSFAIKIT